MSDMAIGQIQQVLAQIRALSSQVRPPGLPGADGPLGAGGPAALGPAGAAALDGSLPGAPSSAGVPFGELLRRGIDAVNSAQQSADALSSAWERGAPGVSLAQVMVETEKASVSFQALSQVRNRLISAYQDIMNMAI